MHAEPGSATWRHTYTCAVVASGESRRRSMPCCTTSSNAHKAGESTNAVTEFVGSNAQHRGSVIADAEPLQTAQNALHPAQPRR